MVPPVDNVAGWRHNGPMKYPTKLAQYLAENGLSQAEFSRRTLIGRAVLTRYVAGYRKPGLTYALVIEKATAGAVPASYWSGFTPRRKTAHAA